MSECGQCENGYRHYRGDDRMIHVLECKACENLRKAEAAAEQERVENLVDDAWERSQ